MFWGKHKMPTYSMSRIGANESCPLKNKFNNIDWVGGSGAN